MREGRSVAELETQRLEELLVLGLEFDLDLEKYLGFDEGTSSLFLCCVRKGAIADV